MALLLSIDLPAVFVLVDGDNSNNVDDNEEISLDAPAVLLDDDFESCRVTSFCEMIRDVLKALPLAFLSCETCGVWVAMPALAFQK